MICRPQSSRRRSRSPFRQAPVAQLRAVRWLVFRLGYPGAPLSGAGGQRPLFVLREPERRRPIPAGPVQDSCRHVPAVPGDRSDQFAFGYVGRCGPHGCRRIARQRSYRRTYSTAARAAPEISRHHGCAVGGHHRGPSSSLRDLRRCARRWPCRRLLHGTGSLTTGRQRAGDRTIGCSSGIDSRIRSCSCRHPRARTAARRVDRRRHSVRISQRQESAGGVRRRDGPGPRRQSRSRHRVRQVRAGRTQRAGAEAHR